MRSPVDLFLTIPRILRSLLTNPRSLQAGLVVFLGLLVADILFRFLVFPPYEEYLSGLGTEVLWGRMDVGFAPILWVGLFTLILGSLSIVISFAAEKVPKLIDLYMDHWPSLLFVWLTVAFFLHAITVKLQFELNMDVRPSLILNFHVFLPLFMVVGFPFILSILFSTKTGRVIENLLGSADAIFMKLARIGREGRISRRRRNKIQGHLFETVNQLIDLLVFVPYKEPKGQIIEGIGRQLISYLEFKQQFPDSYFTISDAISDDISFRTMKGQLGDIEENQTFYEQKIFRVIGNAYNSFLESGKFELSTLCVEQLNRIGQRAVELHQEAMIDLVNVHLNTHLRFALKHGRLNNEPRNLYNLVFHYGQFVGSLVEHGQLERVKTCYGYYVFYGQQCFDALKDAPSLAFILDTIATEMQKGLIRMHLLHWDQVSFKELLHQFLLLDNFQNIERDFAVRFFSKNHGIRLLHIGLALYFLKKQEVELAELIANDTLQDMELLGPEEFKTVMDTIYGRLRYAGPKFWEDTDRGNVNIYYTPYPEQIDTFQKLQNDFMKLGSSTNPLHSATAQ